MFKKITLTALVALVCLANIATVNAQQLVGSSSSWSSNWSSQSGSSWNSGPNGTQRSSFNNFKANSQASNRTHAIGSNGQAIVRENVQNRSFENNRGISESRGLHGVHQSAYNNTRLQGMNGTRTSVGGPGGFVSDTQVTRTNLQNSQGISRGIGPNGAYLNRHNNTNGQVMQGRDIRGLGANGSGFQLQGVRTTGFSNNANQNAGFNSNGSFNNINQSQNVFQNTNGFFNAWD